MPPTRHLKGSDLVRLAEWTPSDDATTVGGTGPEVGADAESVDAARAHLSGCTLCRKRLDEWRRIDDVLAAGMLELDGVVPTPAEEARLDVRAARMRDRLRAAAHRTEGDENRNRPHSDDRAGSTAPSPPKMRWKMLAFVGLALAAGLAFVLVATRTSSVREHSVAAAPMPPRSMPSLARSTPDSTTSRSGDAVRERRSPLPRAPERAVVAVGHLGPYSIAATERAGEETATRGSGALMRPRAARAESEVRLSLERYARAIESGDTAVVHAINPGLTSDSVRSLVAGRGARAFALLNGSFQLLSDVDAEGIVRVAGAGDIGRADEYHYRFRRRAVSSAEWIIVDPGERAPSRPDDR